MIPPRPLAVLPFLLLLAHAAAASPPAVRLTLDEAVAIAVAQSPAARGATAAAAAAKAATERVAAERGVQVRLDSRVTWLSKVASMQVSPAAPPVQLGEHLTWTASLGASKTLWSGGRIPALLAQAEAAAKASDAAVLRALQTAAFAAERAFLLLVAAQEEVAVARQNLAAAESHLGVAKDRFAAGAAARFDVIRAEVQVEEARQTVVQKDAALASAEASLLQALGAEEGEYEAVPPEADPAPCPPLEDLVAAALAARPELETLRWQGEAAAAQVAAAEAELMPLVTVSADYQVVEPDSMTQYDRLAAGAAVTLPVLDGGRARARKGEALQVAAQVRASRDGVRLQVEQEVRQARAKVESALAQVAVARKRIEQSEELLRLAGVRYEGGIGTATEIADAQASLAAGRYGLTRARAEARIAEAELRLAAGVPPGAPLPGRGAR